MSCDVCVSCTESLPALASRAETDARAATAAYVRGEVAHDPLTLELWPDGDSSFELYEVGAGDTWAILYLSTAGFTGVLIIAMLLIRPSSILVGRLVLVPAAIAIIVATLPARKGAAVAIGYLLDPERDAPEKFPQNS